MSKSKIINGKLLIVFVVAAFAVCLISFGAQALATDEATDVTVTDADQAVVAEPANDTTLIVATSSEGTLYSLNNQISFTYTTEESIVAEIKNHVGYIYIKHADGSKTCVAAAFSSDVAEDNQFYEFNQWDIDTSVTGQVTYTAKFQTYNPAVDKNYYFAGQLFDGDNTIAGAEVSWVNMETQGVYITEYTNNFGFAALKIPFGVKGSTHVIADGYVSDYSIPVEYDATITPLYIHVDMMKGTPCTVDSKLSGTTFHVHEYVKNNAIHPGFENEAEDVYLGSLPSRMLPDGAFMSVLTDELCDQYGFKHGSLYYYYAGELPLGANLYEIVFEPITDVQPLAWYLVNNSSNIEMEVGVEYPIKLSAGPYTYSLGKKIIPSSTAQTGDDNLPIVIALIVVVCACGGFVAYRKLRKK